MKNIISSFFKSEEDRRRLNKVVIPSFLVHFVAGILALVSIFIMTRGLGSKQYGIFTYCTSVVFILVYLATNGICVLALRETPPLLSKGSRGLWKGLHKWSVKLILSICISITFLAAAFVYIATYSLHLLKESAYTIPLLIAFTTIPFFGIMNYFALSLRGQHKTVLSLIPENIIKPLIFLFAIGVLYVCAIKFNINSLVIINTLAFSVAALFALIAFYKNTKLGGIEAEYDTANWKKSLKSLFLLTLIMSINSRMDILMLGYLKDPSQVGIYAAADRVASTLVIFLQIMNQISAASISRMHSLDQKQKLQEMVTKISRWVILISFPVFIFIVFFSKWIMSYFGADFESGQTALIIISGAQIINIAFGPVGNFALMTGNQRYTIIFTSINIVINISLNLLLTPSLGINGTAIATACALITWNTGMFLTIRKKTGIRTWVLG